MWDLLYIENQGDVNQILCTAVDDRVPFAGFYNVAVACVYTASASVLVDHGAVSGQKIAYLHITLMHMVSDRMAGSERPARKKPTLLMHLLRAENVLYHKASISTHHIFADIDLVIAIA